MNLASLLLCLVFAAVGYVMHPLVLPELVAADVVSEGALSDEYKKANMPGAFSDDAIVADQKQDRDQPSEDVDSGPRILDEAVGPDSETHLDEPEMDVAAADPETMPGVDVGEPFQPDIPDPAINVPEVITPEPADITGISSDELISLMKQSVRNKVVTQFTYESTKSWTSKGSKDIGGVKYQVGEVTYGAKTIFGDETLRAKALFQDGRLIKWVWPTTNADMN